MALKQDGSVRLGRTALTVCLCAGFLSLSWCGWLFPKPDLPRPEVQVIVSQVVSASEGGTIVVTEEMSPTLAGLELVIPPGALQADQAITIGEVLGGTLPQQEDFVPLGYSFSLQPAGLSFRTPATLRVTFPAEVWQAWSNLISPEEVLLMKYEETSGKWIKVPAQFHAGTLTADIAGFSLWDVVLFWRDRNPASDKKIRDQARSWLPGEDVEPRLRMKPFLDHGALDSGSVKAVDRTFADAIGALLLAEAMWDSIEDGNFYAAASYAELVLETLPKTVLEEVAAKLFGLPTVGLAVTGSAFIIETALKYVLEELGTQAVNNQLRAYLSWRGWFFQTGNWAYNKDLALSHDAAMSDQTILRSDDGWFLCYQRPDGTTGCFSYSPGRPLDRKAEDLFGLGNQLCGLLDRVAHERKFVWYADRELNGLEADRAWLERAFAGRNMPPEVSVVGPDRVVSVGEKVTLQGSASDLEDDPMVWRWTQTDGPAVELEYPWSLSPRFAPSKEGAYAFKLDVWDLLVENRRSAEVAITVVASHQAGRPPTVTTGQATNVTATSATLNSTVNPNGLETSVYFEWGAPPPYEFRTPKQSIGNGMSSISVSANLTELAPSTTYYFRLVAANSAGTTIGTSASFKTHGDHVPIAPSKTVLIYVCSTRDESRDGYGTTWYTGPEHLKPIVDILSHSGYVVKVHDQLTLPELSWDVMRGYSQVWVLESDADAVIETTDRAAADLYRFYQRGGGVWISFENDLGGKYGTWTEDAVPFLEKFGLRYGGAIWGSRTRQPVRSSHRLLDGVKSICFDGEVGYIDVHNPKAEVVWWYESTTPGGSVAGIVALDEHTIDKGRAVFDSGWVLGYAYWKSADNLSFVRNVALWLEPIRRAP